MCHHSQSCSVNRAVISPEHLFLIPLWVPPHHLSHAFLVSTSKGFALLLSPRDCQSLLYCLWEHDYNPFYFQEVLRAKAVAQIKAAFHSLAHHADIEEKSHSAQTVLLQQILIAQPSKRL